MNIQEQLEVDWQRFLECVQRDAASEALMRQAFEDGWISGHGRGFSSFGSPVTIPPINPYAKTVKTIV